MGTFLLIFVLKSPVFWGLLCALYVNWAIREGVNHWVMLGVAVFGFTVGLGLSIVIPFAFSATIGVSTLIYDFVVETMVLLLVVVLTNPHKM